MTLANLVRSVSLFGLLPLLLPLTACLPEIPEGRVSCLVDDDCPRALKCRAARCYSNSAVPDAGLLDASMPDNGASDAGTLDNGTLDTGMPDSGTLDMGGRRHHRHLDEPVRDERR